MKLKKIFFFLFFIILFWVLYFDLSFDNLILVLHPKKITPVSPFYYLILSREKIQSFFIMGQRDTTDWNFTLSQKRIQESIILCNYGLDKLAIKQSNYAKKHFQEGQVGLDNLIDKIDTNYLLFHKNTVQNLINTNKCQ